LLNKNLTSSFLASLTLDCLLHNRAASVEGAKCMLAIEEPVVICSGHFLRGKMRRTEPPQEEKEVKIFSYGYAG